MVDGIEINQSDAEEALLPDDLNSLAVGSYTVPNPNRRKHYPMYVVLVIITTYIASQFIDYVSFIPTFIILTFIIVILFTVDNKFKIQQQEVIERITDKIDHSIGYYSIALTFLFSLKNILTPVWTVIVYSHENPPQFKTIVEINALTGKIVTEPYSENINA